MRASPVRRLLAACALIGVLGALAGCTTHPPPPISAADLKLARDFRLFTFFWVGRSFQGINLSAADSKRDYDATVGMRVYYGDCEKPPSIVSTSGCKLPLEIATVLYRPHSNVGLGPLRETTIRGVPAVVYNGGSSIELYTGHLAIDIYAANPQLARAAADALVPVNRPGPFPRNFVPPKFTPGADPRENVTAGGPGSPRTAAGPTRRG